MKELENIISELVSINRRLANNFKTEEGKELRADLFDITQKLEHYKQDQALQLQQGGVRRSIYEYFTDAEIGLFAHLVKEHSKANGHSEYKQDKLDKLEAKLKQLRSF